jgi:hypothetical protein
MGCSCGVMFEKSLGLDGSSGRALSCKLEALSSTPSPLPETKKRYLCLTEWHKVFVSFFYPGYFKVKIFRFHCIIYCELISVYSMRYILREHHLLKKLFYFY